jgi:thymidylate kinase
MACSTTAVNEGPFTAHRLVIVEGIMGSGKSTTMRLIAKRLQERGQQALPVHERTEPHPVRATDELEHWFEPWRDATPAHLAERALAKWGAFVESLERVPRSR